MPSHILGKSVQGRPIESWICGTDRPSVLVLAGTHGDEPKSVDLARRLLAVLAGRSRSVVVVPVVNPDGYVVRRRKNANGVDINRNFPTSDWVESPMRSRHHGGSRPASEPETRAIIALIDRLRPVRILTLHSISHGRFCNNYDGPAREPAGRMSHYNGYPVRASIGYATPGSFGTWAGGELGLAVVTLELPSHHSAKRCWHDNERAILSFCDA